MFANTGAGNADLRRPRAPRLPGSVRRFHLGLQPALDIQQHPAFLRVPAQRSHHQVVIDVIEETLDVQVQDPVGAPAALPRLPDRLQRRLARSLPIGVWMQHTLLVRLRDLLDHHLGHPVCHRRYPERTKPVAPLRYLDSLHGRRHLTLRRHPAPQDVKVATKSRSNSSSVVPSTSAPPWLAFRRLLALLSCIVAIGKASLSSSRFFLSIAAQVAAFDAAARTAFPPPACRTPPGQLPGCLPDSSGEQGAPPILTPSYWLPTLLQRFTCVRLHSPHLKRSCTPACSLLAQHQAS